ncbi:MAG: hypothetical protein HYU51_16845 [Candidatus Rokubacteria bacterium]|nr:hypothetical protein [Candidatus Rokubacteria bacterium]
MIKTLDAATPRRTSVDALTAGSSEITALLFDARLLADWETAHRHERTVVVGTVRLRGQTVAVTESGASVLQEKIAECRRARDRAAAAWRQAKRRDVLKTALHALARYGLAKIKYEIAVDTLSERRSGLPAPPRKGRLSPERGAILGILHALYDFGIPDGTVSELLALVGFPKLSRHEIKRLRTTYRHP